MKRPLNIGCGPGREGINGGLGVDLNLENCLKYRHRTGAPAVCADACKLPFRSATFDNIEARQVIEHVESEYRFVCELKRVATLGCDIVISSVIRPWLAWYPYKNKKGERVLDPTHVREYTSALHFRLALGVAGIPVARSYVVPLRYSLCDLICNVLKKIQIPIWGYKKVFVLIGE